jgi:phage shock protein C
MMTIFNRSFALDKANGRVMGVCAGLAGYTGIEAIWIRLGFVMGTLLGAGTMILVYLAIGLIADAKPAL